MEVPEWLGWVWRAWFRLHADRPWAAGGMGPPIPGRIPWRDVVEWCAVHDQASEDVAFLDECFAAMDAVWMKWRREQMPKCP